MPFVEFVGMVRKGEEEDILKGRRNWPREGVYNYIDLWFMSRLYRSFNLVIILIIITDRLFLCLY
jgi:surfeit locus 1 family protein